MPALFYLPFINQSEVISLLHSEVSEFEFNELELAKNRLFPNFYQVNNQKRIISIFQKTN